MLPTHLEPIFNGFSKAERRRALEAVALKRYGLSVFTGMTYRPLNSDRFFHLNYPLLFQLLPLDKLRQCLIEHIPQIHQFLTAELDLEKCLALANTVEREEAKFLGLMDAWVDLGADESDHADVSYVGVAQPATSLGGAQ